MSASSRRITDPWPWGLAFATFVLCRPLRSRWLYDFDAAAFAHGIRHFDVLQFHPHPPGYTFYVALAQLVARFTEQDDDALVWLSHFGAVGTTVALYFLGRALLGRRAAILACVLWICSPLAWTYGAVAGTYIFGALGATLVALLCWRRIRGGSTPVAAIALLAGLAGGFRPDVPIVTAPLIAWAAFAGYDTPTARMRAFCSAGLGGLIGLGLWILPAAISAGSLDAYLAAVARQGETVASSNTRDVSAWLAFRGVNLAKVMVYGSLALGPLGALLFVRAAAGWMRGAGGAKPAHRLLALWIGGYLLLFVGVAFGQPGTMLTALPAVCLAVAASLAPREGDDTGRATVLTGCSALVAALLFLAGPFSTQGYGHAGATLPSKVQAELALFTAPGIRLVDEHLGGAVRSIREIPAGESVVLTNVSSWSRAEYYLQDRPVASYFAFRGFDERIPAEQVGEASGIFPLPDGTRTVLVMEIDQHTLAFEDAVASRFETPLRELAPGLHALDLADAPAQLRFEHGRIHVETRGASHD